MGFLSRLFGGGASGDSETSADLAKRPTWLFDDAFSFGDATLDGVRLGDPEARIPRHKVRETNDEGWQICHGGARYRVRDGRVVAFALAERLLERLALHGEADVVRKLGPPDRVDPVHVAGRVVVRTFVYLDRHIGVVVLFDGKIGIVNVDLDVD